MTSEVDPKEDAAFGGFVAKMLSLYFSTSGLDVI
jgi:hypothetical protein